MRKALDSLKVETPKESSELVKNHEETCCAICIDNFEAGTEVRHLTCGHPYHKKCIDPWLMEKGTCPQCKVDVLKQLGLRDSETYADPPTDEESPPHVVSQKNLYWIFCVVFITKSRYGEFLFQLTNTLYEVALITINYNIIRIIILYGSVVSLRL